MLYDKSLSVNEIKHTCNNISDNCYDLNKRHSCKHIDVENYIAKAAFAYYQKISFIVENKGIGYLYSKKIKVVLPHLHYKSNDENLFMISSFHIQEILTSKNLSIANKINILKKIIDLFKQSNFSTFKKRLLIGFIGNVYNCTILNYHFNNNCSWHNNDDGMNIANTSFFYSLLNLDSSYKAISKDLISISLLFIDLEKRFIVNSNTNKIIDYGPYIFENEWKYLERCYRSFMFLLNNLVTNKHKEITFIDICNANAIFGGFQGISTSTYNFPIKKEYANNFLYLLKQGKILDKHFNYSSGDLSNEKKALEIANSINNNLGLNVTLEVVEPINETSYFLLKNKKNTIINKEYLNDYENELINILEGNISQAFEFIIIQPEINANTGIVLQLFISYKHNIPKQTVCETLLRIYYKEYKMFVNQDNSLQKITRAIKLCSLLQRIHPFSDANGRILFFILLPVLLYQMDMWLLRTVYNPWFKLDFCRAEELAKEILNLCVPAPSIKQELNWQQSIDYYEDFRISCALGYKERVIKLLTEHPKLLKTTISLSPLADPVILLKHLSRHNQYELIDYFLKHPNFTEIIFNDIAECLQLSKNENVKALLLAYLKKNF